MCRTADQLREASDWDGLATLLEEVDRRIAELPRAAVALRGRVPVRVTGEGGPIRAGDRLTTSSTPGHAMRYVRGSSAVRGVVIGKALQSFDGNQGTILVLVDLQ